MPCFALFWRCALTIFNPMGVYPQSSSTLDWDCPYIFPLKTYENPSMLSVIPPWKASKVPLQIMAHDLGD